ncbi:MAG TPA: DUF1874 domain-containing protein [Pyrinomonadaceae bacterium]|jgi:hypothetical protein
MKNLTLLNAPILTSYAMFEFKPLTLEQAKEIIHQAGSVQSAIGHVATAEILSELLEYRIEANRIDFYQTIEDVALIFKLKKRIGEGQVLKREEIEKIGYEFGLLKRLK